MSSKVCKKDGVYARCIGYGGSLFGKKLSKSKALPEAQTS
jgi:hypothetical protein